MTHQNPASTEAVKERQERAKQMLVEFRQDLAAAKSERDRWKQRHADLIVSTALIVGSLLLIISGLAWTCMLLMREGCK
jgi:hypothetical protein